MTTRPNHTGLQKISFVTPEMAAGLPTHKEKS
jgi:hypothetical protein